MKLARDYIVYFEIFGKKMKTIVLAECEKEAKQKVLDKIKFHKICEDPKSDFNSISDMFKDLL